MRKVSRILIGAGLSTAVATAACVVLIGFTERFGIRYEDTTVAPWMMGFLIAAPVLGGWWAWVTSCSTRSTGAPR